MSSNHTGITVYGDSVAQQDGARGDNLNTHSQAPAAEAKLQVNPGLTALGGASHRHICADSLGFNVSDKVAHKCHLIRGSILYQRVIKFFFMRIKWAFAAACCTAARPKLEMKSKWKRFNQIIRLQKISSTANVFLMWYCAT